MIINDLKEISYLNLDEEKLNKLNEYMNYTIEENKKFNLTAHDDVDSFLTKNIVDSLLICKHLDLSNKTILDIGSGAGLPGIPLAIYFNTAKFTLLEPLKKRANFLKEVIMKLNLTNVTVVSDRAEVFILNHRESFDFVTSRAVSKLNMLLELSIPYLKVGGKLLAYKGMNYKLEIKESENALRLLSSSLENVYIDTLDFSDETRFNVIIKKNKVTSGYYPRLFKDIKKRPL